jgi:hypothetical protein
MLLLRAERLPEGLNWLYELKLDGYRALAIKTGGDVQPRSRNDKDFNRRYPDLVEALGSMPDETVLDGEVVALDEEGRPSFSTLQNHGPGKIQVHFFTFDLLILRGRDVMAEPLLKRRALIEKHVLPTLADPIRFSPVLQASLPNLIRSVKEQGLEGLVAKRRDSRYEPGERSGAWVKMRVNRAQEFVIGGYTLGGRFIGVSFPRSSASATSSTPAQVPESAVAKATVERSGTRCASPCRTSPAHAVAWLRASRGVLRVQSAYVAPWLSWWTFSPCRHNIIFALSSPILESVPSRSRRVSFTDSEGIEHSVQVPAESLYEAAVEAMAAFRRSVLAEMPLGSATRLTIRVKAPEEEHTVTIGKVLAWLDGVAISPSEKLKKNRLKERLRI